MFLKRLIDKLKEKRLMNCMFIDEAGFEARGEPPSFKILSIDAILAQNRFLEKNSISTVKILSYFPAPNGKSYNNCECPFCKKQLRVYCWAHHKKCECGAVLTINAWNRVAIKKRRKTMMIYLVVASTDKGKHWDIVSDAFQCGFLGSYNKKTANAIMEKYIELTRDNQYKIPKKWFKLVKFKNMEN